MGIKNEGNKKEWKLLRKKSKADNLETFTYQAETLSQLLSVLCEQSQETEEHSKRLKINCLAISEKLRLSEKEKNELVLLALCHDIGKMAIDPAILNKPGKLNAKEWQEMQKHPVIGYRIAKQNPKLAKIADLILSHHEKWDGSGYPQGLSGENIPLASRIIAIVDAYDAMTNDRIYRKALSKEEAITEIQRNKGTQFDPLIADVFIKILQKKKTET